MLNFIYSTGGLEEVNGMIKQTERPTYGYNKFKHLLIRIRLEPNRKKEKCTNYFVLCDNLLYCRLCSTVKRIDLSLKYE